MLLPPLVPIQRSLPRTPCGRKTSEPSLSYPESQACSTSICISKIEGTTPSPEFGLRLYPPRSPALRETLYACPCSCCCCFCCELVPTWLLSPPPPAPWSLFGKVGCSPTPARAMMRSFKSTGNERTLEVSSDAAAEGEGSGAFEMCFLSSSICKTRRLPSNIWRLR